MEYLKTQNGLHGSYCKFCQQYQNFNRMKHTETCSSFSQSFFIPSSFNQWQDHNLHFKAQSFQKTIKHLFIQWKIQGKTADWNIWLLCFGYVLANITMCIFPQPLVFVQALATVKHLKFQWVSKTFWFFFPSNGE